MVRYTVKAKPRFEELVTKLWYYSRYGNMPYYASSDEWSEYLSKVLPSELPNVIRALSVHLDITINETESEETTEAGTKPDSGTSKKKAGK